MIAAWLVWGLSLQALHDPFEGCAKPGPAAQIWGACCPPACGKCGGSGCELRRGGRSACCAFDVRDAAINCSGAVPPCVLPGHRPFVAYTAMVARRVGQARRGAHDVSAAETEKRRTYLTNTRPNKLSAELRASLDAGVMETGSSWRLRTVLQRVAIENRPLVVAALGSSVVATYAGHSHRTVTAHGWMRPVFEYLRETLDTSFLGANRSQPTFARRRSDSLLNAGQAGRPIGVYLQCSATRVPPADVYVVEVGTVMTAANVTSMDLMAQDALWRRLLLSPRAPYVLVVSSCRWCRHRPSNHAHNVACFTAASVEAHAARCEANERGMRRVAAHYALPFLSVQATVRAALHRHAPPLAATADLAAQVDDRGVHPMGLRGPFSRLLSAMIMRHLERALGTDVGLTLPSRPALTPASLEKPHRANRAAVPPCTADGRWPRGDADSERTEVCYHWDRTVHAWAGPTPLAADLQPAEGSRGWNVTTFDTAHSAEPPTYCRAPVDGAAPRSKCPKRKPGLTTFAAGSVAILALENPLGGAARRVRATLTLSHLVSYDNMGLAEVRCEVGCSCASTVLNGSTAEIHSIVVSTAIPIKLEASPSCQIRLEAVAQHGAAGGSKFKLSAVSLAIKPDGRPAGAGCSSVHEAGRP